jgi:hypothetical protein
MRGNNNRTIGDIIRKLMKNPKLSGKLDELDALQVWEELVGEQICKYIINQKIYKRVLYVKLKSAVVRNELSYKKTEFIRKINQRIGKKLLADIVLK